MATRLSHINWAEIDELACAGCTIVEIAAYFGVHRETMQNHYKYALDNMNEDEKQEMPSSFSSYLKDKREKGKAQLRLSQFKQATEGNVPMQIWLGKQRLDQKDNKSLTVDDKRVIKMVNGVDLPKDEEIKEEELDD